ncbi:hypothetical protein MPSEU_000260800 [Mayamaea pseudoterrestris]|nr:hypothetical protein MPSEU_000260800 [Mayamaea pseudoterrestris]
MREIPRHAFIISSSGRLLAHKTSTMVTMNPLSNLQPVLVLFAVVLLKANFSDADQFTYRSDASSSSSNNIYSPQDWDQVECTDLETCSGWPDKFLPSIDWKLDENACEWCPADGSGNCGSNSRQSPINLERNRAINASEWHNNCVDTHLMRYYDSSCTFDELVRLNAFSIERHALKITQPIEPFNNTWRLACEDERGHQFGRIDFSKGFSHWWHLDHTNFKVPSEHTQEGRRYDAEMQLFHFYSASAAEAGVSNQMAAVTIFLQAYDDAPDYDVLNKVICQWRKAEDATREQCGLPSVQSYYPGCFYNNRGHDGNSGGGGGNTRHLRKAQSAQDVLQRESKRMLQNPTEMEPFVMHIEDDFEEPVDFDWEEFIADVYRQEEENAHGRHLMDYEHIGPWHNYFGLLGVKTEYYYRYSGTQTIPPCFGKFTPGDNRANTNHWRVMKDPIRVSERQIDEMHRLLKDRIAPSDDPFKACKPDTAAATYEGNENRVNVSRPLMMTEENHFMTFCECTRWKSLWVEDNLWCDNKNETSRFYEQPYNFVTDGF